MSSRNGDGEEVDRACIPFISPDPVFRRGWECGCAWAMMREGYGQIDGAFYAENEPQLRLTAHEMGYVVERDGGQPGYVFLTFTRRQH